MNTDDYDVDADRIAREDEARREDDDAMYVAQLLDMVAARGVPWIAVRLLNIGAGEE